MERSEEALARRPLRISVNALVATVFFDKSDIPCMSKCPRWRGQNLAPRERAYTRSSSACPASFASEAAPDTAKNQNHDFSKVFAALASGITSATTANN